MGSRDVTIAAERPDGAEVVALIGALDAYLAALYPAESNHGLSVAALLAPSVRFLVARRAGVAIGCGAIVLESGYAELKRMYVAPEARGLGVGRRLLAALDAAAAAEGRPVLRLETGGAQPEALALYRSAGFVETPPFGAYAADPLSIFMARRSAGGDGAHDEERE
jgi:putative acetyltransferase